MAKRFETAEQLMEHLRDQIMIYPEKIESVRQSKPNINGIDLRAVEKELNSNNLLWNVTAERPITSHRKMTGKFIVFGKKVVRKFLRWYVSLTFELQSSFNGSATRTLNETYNILVQLKAKQEEQEAFLNKQEALISRQEVSNQLGIEINSLKIQNKVIIQQLEEMKEQKLLIEDQNMYIERLEDKLKSTLSEHEITIEELKTLSEQVAYKEELHLLKNELNKAIHSESNFVQFRLRQLKKQISTPTNLVYQDKQSLELDETRTNTSGEVNSNLFDYLQFENRFRGSVEEIKERQTVYLPYFEGKSNVLDIGAGRGEFVELMIDHNISIKGIDINQDMVDYCQDRGLPVDFYDALDYLQSLENNSLDGVFMGQVIEHMSFEQILKLVELVYDKIKKGSYFIMETPNPLSLSIFYRTFYVDPTHVKPIHPVTIQYIADTSGFVSTELQFSSPIEPNHWLPKLKSSDEKIENLNEFNQGVQRLNELLYGNLDYALIAKK